MIATTASQIAEACTPPLKAGVRTLSVTFPRTIVVATVIAA